VISPPRYDETPEPRNYIGWVLTLLFILLTSAFASQYYASVGSDQYRRAQAVDKALREAVLSRTALQQALWKVFERELATIEKTDPARFALFRAVASYERTQTVDPRDIQALKQSKNPAHQAIADVYTVRYSKKQLARADARINKDLFVGVLAGIHLHERSGDARYRSSKLPKDEGRSLSLWIQIGSLAVGTAIGLVLLAAYVGLRSAGFLKPLGHPLQNIGLFDADRLAMRSAQIMAVTALAAMLSSTVRSVDSDWLAVAEALISAAAVLALTMTPVWGRRFRCRDVGLTSSCLLKNIGWGLAGFFANIPILIFVSIVSQGLFSSMPNVNHPIVTEIRNASGLAVWLAVFLAASFQAPIIEEVLFRGTLLPAMTRVFQSPVCGIVLSSLIFAVGHSTGLPSWLPLASIGAMAAALTYQTRSLVPAIVMHSVHNTAMLVLTVFFVQT